MREARQSACITFQLNDFSTSLRYVSFRAVGRQAAHAGTSHVAGPARAAADCTQLGYEDRRRMVSIRRVPMSDTTGSAKHQWTESMRSAEQSTLLRTL